MPRKSRLSRSQHYSSNGSSENFPALSRRLARMKRGVEIGRLLLSSAKILQPEAGWSTNPSLA